MPADAPAVKVEGTRSYTAPRERVWEVLNDPAEMAGLMPGVENFEIVDDTHHGERFKKLRPGPTDSSPSPRLAPA